jgi:pimeloyl-ACP methyl ester carboxylesterase
MPSTSIQGCSVYYEIFGQGVPVVITPGGLGPLDWARGLAESLASHQHRVILWDRPNTGRSDVLFEGASDLDLWSDILAELLIRLDASPAYFVAPSAGARTSVQTVLRYPDVARGMFLWLLTGGHAVSSELAENYYRQYADMAEKGGMQAVVEAPYWQERIEMNPANKGRLLAIKPQDFVRVVHRWMKVFNGEDPMIGATEDDLRRISLPTCVVAGYDWGHPPEVAERVAQLIPEAEFIDPPGFAEEWAALQDKFRPGTGYHSVSLLPPLIHDFVMRTEANLGP